jgi:hypothetical protein
VSTVISDTKLVSESVDISIDFLSRLQVGETLQTCASAMSVLTGVDLNPAAMLSGLPTISGTSVIQNVVAGNVGTIYILSLSARTSENNIFVMETAIAVMPSNAIVPP